MDLAREMDRQFEMNQEAFEDILHTPEPERYLSSAPPPELYNLAEDPAEERSLAETEPERTQRMLHLLEAWFEDVEQDRRSSLR